MESRCSNCGGVLARGSALGACYRCGHALTGANWELLPPSRPLSRPSLHTAWLIGGGALIGIGIAAASFALFGDEEEAPQRVRVPNITVSVGALAPASTAPGSPAQSSPSAPTPSSAPPSASPVPVLAPPASSASH
jgi:hypothetical protein